MAIQPRRARLTARAQRATEADGKVFESFKTRAAQWSVRLSKTHAQMEQGSRRSEAGELLFQRGTEGQPESHTSFYSKPPFLLNCFSLRRFVRAIKSTST